MKIAVGSLDQNHLEYEDLGTFSEDRTDYPVYGEKVARAVASGEFDKGLLFCGTGVGISLAANKVAGIRAVVCSEPYTAIHSRRHNDTNVLALGSRVVGNRRFVAGRAVRGRPASNPGGHAVEVGARRHCPPIGNI